MSSPNRQQDKGVEDSASSPVIGNWRSHFLEYFLILAVIILLLQVFPDILLGTVYYLDVRNWPWVQRTAQYFAVFVDEYPLFAWALGILVFLNSIWITWILSKLGASGNSFVLSWFNTHKAPTFICLICANSLIAFGIGYRILNNSYSKLAVDSASSELGDFGNPFSWPLSVRLGLNVVVLFVLLFFVRKNNA